MEVVGAEFREKVMDYNDNWLHAKAVIERALECRKEIFMKRTVLAFKMCLN